MRCSNKHVWKCIFKLDVLRSGVMNIDAVITASATRSETHHLLQYNNF